MVRGRLALVALVLGGLVTPVGAENVGITGRKLIIVDKGEFSGVKAARFLAIDPLIRKGSGLSLATIGAIVDITIEAPDHSPIMGAFSVPQGFSTTAGWRVNTSSIAKFINAGAPGGPTQVRALTIQQNRMVKLFAKGLGDLPLSLDDLRFGPFHVQVRVVVLNGAETINLCTLFRSDRCLTPFVGAGTGRKIQCVDGEAVPDCAFPAVP
jgi:hypothetical protein